MIMGFFNFTLMVVYNSFVIFFMIWYKILHYLLNFKNRKEITEIKNKMLQELDFGEWKNLAMKFDQKTGRLGWRYKPNSRFYDYGHIQSVIKYLNHLMLKKKNEELIGFLKALHSRSSSGIKNHNLYNHSLSGTKLLISDYYSTVIRALDYVKQLDFPEKQQFFDDLRRVQGNSALLLSGGGMLGTIHLGILPLLRENDCLPNIITGSSSGSLVCSLFATSTKEELDELIRNDFQNLDYSPLEGGYSDSWWMKLRRFYRTGYMMDKKVLTEFVKINTKELTFLEAFKRTGVVLNIAITDSIHDKS